MAADIKGITIEFNGDTTSLDKALRKVSESAKGIDKELKSVNNALKFNPRNTELLAQKQTLLKQKVSETEKSLKSLKDIQAQMDADPSVDKNSEEYRRLQREIITTESKLKHYAAQLKQANLEANKVYQVGKAWEEAGGKIEGAGRSLAGVSRAAAVVAGALGGLAVHAGVAADDINTLSKVTGISTHDLQMYAAMADLVDVSVEDMAKGQQRLKKSMLTASEGGSTAKYFERLGINVKNADGSLRDASDVFDETIAALGKMEDETTRDAVAMALMGRSAANLNPLIEDGGQTYARVAKIMEENGLEPVDQAALDRANEFKDAIDTIKLMFTQLAQIVGTKIAGYLVPAMEKVVGVVAKISKRLSKMDGKTLSIIMGITAAVAALAPALIILGKVINGVGKAIQTGVKVVSGLSQAMSFLAANPIVLIIAGIVALVAALVILWKKSESFRNFWITTWNTINTVTTTVWNAITGTFTAAWNKIKAVWNGVVAYYRALWNGIVAVFSGTANWFGNIFGAAWNAIKNKFAGWGAFWSGLWTTLKSKFTGLGTALGNALSGAVKGGLNKVISNVESIINSAITLINKAIGLANKLPGVTVGKVSKLKLPRLAKGGVLNGAQTVIAGEAGPEAIIPLDRLFSELDRMTNRIIAGSGGAMMAQAMTSAMAQMGGQLVGAMPGGITLNINGQEIARAIWSDLANEGNRRGAMFAPTVTQVKGAAK